MNEMRKKITGAEKMIRLLRIIDYLRAEPHTVSDVAKHFSIRRDYVRKLLDQWGSTSHSCLDPLDSVTIHIPESNDDPIVIERDQGTAMILQPRQDEAAVALAACIQVRPTTSGQERDRLDIVINKLATLAGISSDRMIAVQPEFLGAIAETVHAEAVAECTYIATGERRLKMRVDPQRLRQVNTVWYVDVWKEKSGMRSLRVDRIRDWKSVPGKHETHDLSGEKQFSTNISFLVPDSSRWLTDLFPWSVPLETIVDGQKFWQITTAVASEEWWTQMWLSYGLHMHTDPADKRREAAAKALALYDETTTTAIS